MKIYFGLTFSVIFVFFGIIIIGSNQQVNSAVVIERQIETRSYKDIVNLLNELEYTSENWQAGNREIPRVHILSIPPRWQKTSTLSVKEKKSIFFRLIVPGILRANEKILKVRERLVDEVLEKDALTSGWLRSLAIKYKVIKATGANIKRSDLDELLLRVDVIPPSLALAQAAIESSWGTSRFAVEGSSLFGQWDFSGNGIKPKDQRSGLGNYGIAKYDSPQASIESYMHNLNTNRAYRELRNKRSSLRKQNKKNVGMQLISTLGRYSERGDAYIKELQAIVRYNKFETVDDAYLWDRGEIIISPVL